MMPALEVLDAVGSGVASREDVKGMKIRLGGEIYRRRGAVPLPAYSPT
jgi:hypothetical protein